MANMYRSVLAGGGGVQPTGDAVAADVLTGKTFSNADGIGKTGTMPNNGAVSGTATPSQPYTIPAGYHNGSGTVTAAITNNADFVFSYVEGSKACFIDLRDLTSIKSQAISGSSGTVTFGDVTFTMSSWAVSVNADGVYFAGTGQTTQQTITPVSYTSGGTIPSIASSGTPYCFKLT